MFSLARSKRRKKKIKNPLDTRQLVEEDKRKLRNHLLRLSVSFLSLETANGKAAREEREYPLPSSSPRPSSQRKMLGGTSLAGGVGRMTGTVIGTVILGILTSGFTFLNVDAHYQEII